MTDPVRNRLVAAASAARAIRAARRESPQIGHDSGLRLDATPRDADGRDGTRRDATRHARACRNPRRSVVLPGMAAVDHHDIPDDPDADLTKADAARLAGQSVRTIERWIRDGRDGVFLPCYDYGHRNVRIRRRDLDAFREHFRRSDMLPADVVDPDAST